MAREARKISKSGNYYIELKGVELFFSEEDKQTFREILERNFAEGKIYGCEMTRDEIRFAVKEDGRGISACMKPVTTSYARYFNRTYDREGKLFLGRFKSKPLETEEDIREALKAVKTGDSKKRSAAAKKTAQKPAAKAINHISKAPKEETPKPQPKKNLPSWLL